MYGYRQCPEGHYPYTIKPGDTLNYIAFVLGKEPKNKFGMIDIQKARKEIKELSDRYGLKVDPDAKISDISVGMQQRVEILKTLYRGAEVLIFDEPTAVLTPQEISELLDIMRSLGGLGGGVFALTIVSKGRNFLESLPTTILLSN